MLDSDSRLKQPTTKTKERNRNRLKSHSYMLDHYNLQLIFVNNDAHLFVVMNKTETTTNF